MTFAPEFQKTHLPQPRHRKPAVRRPKVCCSATAFTTGLQKQHSDLKLPCCPRSHHWAMEHYTKRVLFDTFWHWKMHDLRRLCTSLYLRYICSRRFGSTEGLIYGCQGTNRGYPSFQCSQPDKPKDWQPNPQPRGLGPDKWSSMVMSTTVPMFSLKFHRKYSLYCDDFVKTS